MSNESSEQLLKALDQSKEDSSSLLEQAESILGLKYDIQVGNHEKARPVHVATKSNGFKEQWLLRWMLKRLHAAVQESEASTHGNKPQKFVRNGRTWSFLSYLIRAIPERNALEILLERSFTRLLTAIGTTLLQHVPDNLPIQVGSPSHVQDHERPRKRQRLSPSLDEAPLQHNSVNSGSFWITYINVVDAWNNLLQPRQQSSALSSRSVTAAWAESVKDAAEFLRTTLQASKLFYSTETENSFRALAASVTTKWLQLWHSFSVSNNTVERKVVSQIFNETCLNECLKLHSLCSRMQEKYDSDVRKEIERQIALYAILPLRSAFNAKHATAWTKLQGSISWHNIEPIMATFKEQLGNAIQTERVADYDVTSLSDPSWASRLVSIAARLTPKEDIRARQRERHWLEGLTISLAYFAFPRDIPRMHKSSDNMLEPEKINLPPSSASSQKWPDDLLATLVTEDMRFSAPAKDYIVSSVLAWRTRPIPLPLMSTLVRLDPSLFVPEVGQPNSNACLGALMVALTERKSLNQMEHEATIKDIIYPVLEAFLQARNFDGLFDLWLTNLEEAMRVRATATFSTDDIPSALLWDDEDVFTHFTHLYRSHAPVSFGSSFLENTISEMKAMPQRIGTTVDIFAKLAILQSIIKVRGKDFATNHDRIQDLNTLVDLVVDGLKQQSDYQGQRWRLWTMMTLCCNLQPQLDHFDSVADMIESTCARFRSERASKIEHLQQSQRSAILMEQYAIFALLVQACTTNINHGRSSKASFTKLCRKELKYLSETLEASGYALREGSVSQLPTSEASQWNGKLNSLRSIPQLVSGQLACLIQLLMTANAENKAVEKLLSPLDGLLRGDSDPLGSRLRLLTDIAASLLDGPSIDINQLPDVDSKDELPTEMHASAQNFTYDLVHQLAQKALMCDDKDLRNDIAEAALSEKETPLSFLKSTVSMGTVIMRADEFELKQDPKLAKSIASTICIRRTRATERLSDTVLQLEKCMLTLKSQPGVVNQALVDGLLADLALYLSPVTIIKDFPGQKPAIVFDRLVDITGILLSRYRRRLTGRTHLFLPVLQGMLRCFFYTPSRTYMYQNAATGKQKQAFRSLLPTWLSEHSLPTSSAVKFSKILSSVCNPTTASARSAHRRRTKKGSMAVELNDETQKAKRIAAQYMQYLVMEYARCTLDGVIQPEVKSKLMSGIFSILDAMDKDLMSAMNAAMDPSSRAIFKDLYDDWTKHWKWDQS